MSHTDSDFDTLCQAATRLVALLPHPPATLKLQHGQASAELTWATDTVPQAAPLAAQVTAQVTAQVAEDDGLVHVTAPLVGTFYHSPEPGATPFVSPGDAVEVGQQVGIVESMKLMNPIVAETAGQVVDFLVPDGMPVEYGQSLVALVPSDGDSACGTLFPGSRRAGAER